MTTYNTAVRTRRDVLATLGAAGAVALAGCGGEDDAVDDGGTEREGEDDSVVVGVAVPTTGRFSDIGEELSVGYQLAARHLSEGADTFTTPGFEAISEDGGILGQAVELAFADTQSDRQGAEQAANTLLDTENADVLVGGGSREEALGLRDVADERAVIYMAGYTPTAAITGPQCSEYVFNEIATPPMIAEALRPTINDAFASEFEAGETLNYIQLAPDNDAGDEFIDAFERIEEDGWTRIPEEQSRVGAQSYSDEVAAIFEAGADLAVLNYTGLEGSRVLSEFEEQAAAEGSAPSVVIPFSDRSLAANAGSAYEEVITAAHWTPAVGGEFSESFADSWSAVAEDDTGVAETASSEGHVAYVQLAQYAAAAERAGAFDADDIVRELADHDYDVGLGEASLRRCDHQSDHGVLRLRGLPPAQQESGTFAELQGRADDVIYLCRQGPAAQCDR